MKLPFEFKVLARDKDRYLAVFPNDPSVMWIRKPVLDILRLGAGLPESKYSKDAFEDLRFLKKTGFLKHKNTQPWTRLNSKPNLVRLHLTHRCNLDCPYCYSSDFRDEYNKLHPADMDWPTAKKIIDWVFKINRDGSNSYIDFMFFGGEPLLNLGVMERSLRYIKNVCEKDRSKAVTFSIGTNGTLIDEEVARILKRYNVVTLITMHNKDREAFKTIMKGKIDTLRRFLPDRNIIITYIIRDKRDIRDTGFLIRKIKGIVHRFAFDLRLKDRNLKGLLEEMDKFVNKDKLVFYGNFEEIEALISGIKVTEDCGASQNRLSFLPDGTMQSCSGPRGDTISCSSGDMDKGLDVKHARIARPNDRRKTDCMKCWMRSYCKGMCKYGNKKPSVLKGKNLLCDANRIFMEHLIKWYAGLTNSEILDVTTKRVYRDSIDIGKERQKYENTKLILRFRDLRNEKLRYVRLVTPSVPKG